MTEISALFLLSNILQKIQISYIQKTSSYIFTYWLLNAFQVSHMRSRENSFFFIAIESLDTFGIAINSHMN